MYPENEKMIWIKGDITNPEDSLKSEVNDSDLVIHAAVTMQEVFKKKNLEDYNSCKSLLKIFDRNKKIIYISSESMPFENNKYFEVKRKSEEALLKT